MRLYRMLTFDRFHLWEANHSRRLTVSVLCCKHIINLYIVAELCTLINNLIEKVKVIDATERISVNIILAVCATQLFESDCLSLGFLEIKELVFIN